jgi:hypothetical protein
MANSVQFYNDNEAAHQITALNNLQRKLETMTEV